MHFRFNSSGGQNGRLLRISPLTVPPPERDNRVSAICSSQRSSGWSWRDRRASRGAAAGNLGVCVRVLAVLQEVWLFRALTGAPGSQNPRSCGEVAQLLAWHAQMPSRRVPPLPHTNVFAPEYPCSSPLSEDPNSNPRQAKSLGRQRDPCRLERARFADGPQGWAAARLSLSHHQNINIQAVTFFERPTLMS